MYAVLLPCMIYGTGVMRRLLDRRPFVFLGRISYSLYLWHLVPVQVAANEFAPTQATQALAWGVLAAAVGMAWASHQWIEVPFLRCGTRLRRRLRQQLAPSRPQPADAAAVRSAYRVR